MNEQEKTLRDEFAKIALASEISRSEMVALIAKGRVTKADVCQLCYDWADAMLEARNGKS